MNILLTGKIFYEETKYLIDALVECKIIEHYIDENLEPRKALLFNEELIKFKYEPKTFTGRSFYTFTQSSFFLAGLTT